MACAAPSWRSSSAAAWSRGRKIEIIKASSDAKPDVAVNATRKLVEQDKVDIMVGPLSGGEGIAVKDYSKTQPQVTFINGGSGAQATTLVNPSPNFFRFNTEGAQWMAAWAAPR
jgi:branched-chain amino acid transport system substrate-binding protein